VSEFFEKQNLSLSPDTVRQLRKLTGGFPEYITPFAQLFLNEKQPNNPLGFAQREWENPQSMFTNLCRYVWLNILHMARGYAVLKAAMQCLAVSGPVRLTALAKLMGNSPPAVKDYLYSLIRVGAVKREGYLYSLTDPFLKEWITFRTTHCMPSSERVDSIENLKPLTQQENKDYKPHRSDNSFLEFD